MPNGTGEELLVAVRGRHPKLPIMLMITGYSELTEAKAKELGAAELLKKPIDFEGLPDLFEKYGEMAKQLREGQSGAA